MQDAGDAGRTLVAGGAQPQALDQRVVGGQAGDRDGARVRHVGEQRAQGDHHLHAQRLGQLHDHVAERAPAVGRLVPDEEDEVARRARDASLEQLGLGPGDLAAAPLGEADARAGGLEVEELLGVDAGEAAPLQGRADEADRGGGGVRGVVPALERADERGRAQGVRPAIPDQGRHRFTVARRRPGRARSRPRDRARHARARAAPSANSPR